MPELWKDISGYYNYQVSDLGKIKNKNTGRLLKERLNAQGYNRVRLYKNGVGKNMFVHRIVANEFLPNENINFTQINHKDENKLNNNVSNLEWCDAKYNMTYGNVVETRASKNRKKVGQHSLNGKLLKIFESLKEASIFLGIKSCGHISQCCRKKRKTAYGYKWSFYLGGV